ncbi:S9 family peptidase [Pseudidiomarina sp.]|uniref:S9 family peptidase n=1 Tax=Pseudidiomarina sp. TaxID=2081707 RepID=UPI00299E2F28|nr:alpha/beta fold hydrolase [Pseudidiomarina sp.]MDX1706318.1 alpha/beta fold hydrolase [Pseudidiomarina sp.]
MKKITTWLIASAMALVIAGCSKAPEVTGQSTPDIPKYNATTFFDTTSIGGSSVSHDGQAVLVTSDATGVFNVYRYPVDGSPQTQLTNSTTNAIRGVSWFPADDRFLYTSDEGGNELDHLYVMEIDGRVRDLTPGENLKAYFSGWHDDDKHFFVATNERDPQAFDLYRYSTEDYSRELLFENTAGWSLSSISGDGRWLAMTKVHSNADNDIWLADLSSADAELMHVTPHTGNVSHNVYTFSPDNTRLIYGTDAYGEFVQAWSYDISSGEASEEYISDWDVAFLYYSPEGRYQVTGVNADAQTKLHIIDQTNDEIVQLPPLPPANVSGVNFSDDESLMVFYLSSDTAPANLYSWAIGSDDGLKLSDTLSDAIDPAHLVSSTVERYPSFDELLIPGLLFQPHTANATNKVPAVIYIHGGPGGQTRKGYNPMVQHLVNHGYAMFGVNNRGSSGYGKTFFHLDDKRHGEDDLQDIVYAKKYLQSLDWVDGDRIAVMGGSYGGYLTMAAMAFTNEFDAGINIFGVTNWVRTLESIPPWWAAQRQALYDELGDPATERERLERISPLFYAHQIQQPVLVVQGANDPRVLQIESDEMVAAIEANDVPVEYVLFEDEGHGFRKKANRIVAQEAYLEFLNTHLK